MHIERFGQGIDPIERQTQRLAHIAHRGTRPVGNHLGRHPGAVAAVLVVDILNDFFAPLVLEIDIDIGGLVPLAADEPLENNIPICSGSTAVISRQ